MTGRLCRSVQLLRLVSHQFERHVGERVGVLPVVVVTTVLLAVFAILALRSQDRRRIAQVVSLVVFLVCVSGFASMYSHFAIRPDTPWFTSLFDRFFVPSTRNVILYSDRLSSLQWPKVVSWRSLNRHWIST